MRRMRGGHIVARARIALEGDVMIPSRVTLVDVGPRDGLQNEKQTGRRGRQDRARAPPAGRRPARDRGHELRQPEVGAADGRQRGRDRRHREEARRPLLGADPEHEGPRRRALGAARRVARRDRRLRRGDRGVQPEEHQLLDRREHRALPAGRRRGARATASRCAARSRARSAARTRARSAPTRSSASSA